MKLNTSICRIHTLEGGHMRRWSLLLAGLATIMLLAACGSDGPGPGPSIAPTTDSATTETPAPPDGEGGGAPTGLDAYRGMWQAYLEAIAIPDPEYPDLARYAQGNALDVLVNGLRSVQEQGLVGVGDVAFSPRVVGELLALTPPQVEIEDCADTSQSRLVKQDGSPYEDTPGGRRSATATAVQLGDGTWRISEFAMRAVGTC